MVEEIGREPLMVGEEERVDSNGDEVNAEIGRDEEDERPASEAIEDERPASEAIEDERPASVGIIDREVVKDGDTGRLDEVDAA